MTNLDMQELVAKQAESLDKLMEKRKEIEKQIQDEGKELFYNSVKSIFEEYGDILHSYCWTQYTPYFNDGEECVFGVHEVAVRSQDDMKGEDTDFEESNYYESSGDFSTYSKKRPKIAPTIWKYDEERTWNTYPRGYGNPEKHSEIRTVESAYEPWSGKSVVGEIEKFDNPEYDPRYAECLKAVNESVNRIDEQTMKTLFGDHALVIVSASGVEVEEYDHD